MTTPDLHNPLISVVIPNYKCGNCLEELVQRLKNTLGKIDANFEIVIINDASPDNSWEAIQAFCRNDERVKGINFSRNFGQHHAITAGLDVARGQWIVVMDCDLQDQPEEISKLYAKAQEGYDVVLAKRYMRQDNVLKKASSFAFYHFLDYFTDFTSDHTVANFGIYSHQVISGAKLFPEQTRNFPLLVRWMGFKVAYVNVEHSARSEGKSSYSLRKLFTLAGDSVISYTNKPLRLSIKLGFIISALSFIYGAYVVYLHYFRSIPVMGWTSVIVSIYFMGGVILSSVGMLGLYIGKIYDETKHRPLYIVKEKIGL